MELEIPIDELRKLLRYDPETGELTWLLRPRGMFSTTRSHTIWNVRFANKRACSYLSHDGYLRGTMQRRQFLAHRVAWALHHGGWPADQIDHINGDRSDNRIVNLRAVTRIENGKNRKTYTTNTSGHAGIRWDKKINKWVVRIQSDGIYRHIGVFSNLDEAVNARANADVQYEFHPNHGHR
jgi:hypothetical protein